EGQLQVDHEHLAELGLMRQHPMVATHAQPAEEDAVLGHGGRTGEPWCRTIRQRPPARRKTLVASTLASSISGMPAPPERMFSAQVTQAVSASRWTWTSVRKNWMLAELAKMAAHERLTLGQPV